MSNAHKSYSTVLLLIPSNRACTQQAATSGAHPNGVIAFEPEQTYLDKGKDRIEKSVLKLVSKGKMTQEDADKALGSITFTTNMDDLKDTDFIVEAGETVVALRYRWRLSCVIKTMISTHFGLVIFFPSEYQLLKIWTSKKNCIHNLAQSVNRKRSLLLILLVCRLAKWHNSAVDQKSLSEFTSLIQYR